VLYLITVRFLPAGEQIAPSVRDELPWALPSGRRLQAEDVAAVRLPVALRGYRFAETDKLLDRLAEEIRQRDEEIARLRGDAPEPVPEPVAEPVGEAVPEPVASPIAEPVAEQAQPEEPEPTEDGPPMTSDAPPRCGWAVSDPDYIRYHDEEWGRPLHGDTALFERLSLEAFQSGLSWLVILRKRPAFRAAFAGFDIDAVAAFGKRDVARLLADPGIVRNRAKIEATIANARAVRDAVPEGLDALLWSFAPEQRRHDGPRRATSPESVAMAKELKRRGLRFVGPTTAYALMQATGMVDDHVRGCWRATGR
jgi:DNA-3-methyladenine glycosylase I